MTYDPFAVLRDFVGGQTPTAPALAATAATTNPKLVVPAPSTITLITANYYDNGPREKVRFDSSQHTMNLQLFCVATPFTPAKNLVAWEGTLQLHEPGYMSRYTESYLNDFSEKMTREQRRRINLICLDSEERKTGQEPLIGVFVNKGKFKGGTTYLWDNFARTYWTDTGMKLEIWIQGTKFEIFEFDTVNDRIANPPKLRGRYDPDNLWISKGAA